MKILHSIIGMTLTFGMAITLPSAASPIEANEAKTATERLAYLDLNSATSYAEKEQILAARYAIIYGDQAWTVDHAVSVLNYTTGTVTALPDFYDLFPDDWDIPAISDGHSVASASGVAKPSSNVEFVGNVSIVASTGHQGSIVPFFRFTCIKNNVPIGLYLSSFPGTNYNAGFCDEYTGKGIGWCPGLVVRETGLQLNHPILGARYGSVVCVENHSAMGRVKQDYVSNFSRKLGW